MNGWNWPSSVEVRIKLLAGNRTPSGVRRLEFGRHLERLVVAVSCRRKMCPKTAALTSSRYDPERQLCQTGATEPLIARDWYGEVTRLVSVQRFLAVAFAK